MVRAVSDDAAVAFATGFYQGITHPDASLKFAFQLGTQLVATLGLNEDHTPKLVAGRANPSGVRFYQAPEIRAELMLSDDGRPKRDARSGGFEIDVYIFGPPEGAQAVVYQFVGQKGASSQTPIEVPYTVNLAFRKRIQASRNVEIRATIWSPGKDRALRTDLLRALRRRYRRFPPFVSDAVELIRKESL